MPVGSGGEVKSARQALPHPTHGYFVLSPVSLVSRDQGGSPSNSMIDTHDLTEK